MGDDLERCAVLYRTSTVGQITENQEPDVEKYVSARRYKIVRVIKIKKSGSSGIHAGDLQGVLRDMEDGLYRVVVVAHSSRLDRRDEAEQVRFELALHDVGGRVESARENGRILPTFRAGQGARHVAVAAQSSNAEYSRTLKENIGAGVRAAYEAGAFVGRVPWGFTAEGPRQGKRLTATAMALEWVPQVYRRVAAGESLSDTARWLTENQVPTGPATRMKNAQWWAKTVGTLVRNTAYMGSYEVQYTVTWHTYDDAGDREAHSETLVWTHHGDAVVGRSLWHQANDKLTARRGDRRGPRAPRKSELEPLSSASYCARCLEQRDVLSPMYRKATRDGLFLYCSGRGASRKGCGLMLPMDEARAEADRVLGAMTMPEYEFGIEPGNIDEIDDNLDRIERERVRLARRGLSWEDEDAERAKLREEYDYWQSVTRIPDRKVLLPVLVDGEQDTWGRVWQRLDAPGRRAWLKSGRFLALADKDSGGQPVIAVQVLDS